MITNRSITEVVLTAGAECGFDALGIATVPVNGSAEDLLERQRFREWIEAGSAGGMEYLKRRDESGELVRSSLRVAVPWARSVIVCVTNYESAQIHSTDPAPEDAAWIARYAWTANGERPSDYHRVILKRLRTLEERLHAELGDFQSRSYIDTGPLVERVYAQYAGIGWTGKNTCILNQNLGSWLFLGVILTGLELPAEERATLAEDRCGTCRRCLDACPTGALTAPYQMDATRCISYLTIEERGPIPEDLRSGIGRNIFGCDICQDVCPWNRKAPVGRHAELAPRDELINPALAWLGAMDEAQFAATFYGSPVSRAKYAGFRRNVAIAMGNSGQKHHLGRLAEWVKDGDAVLAEAARWAMRRLEGN